MTWNFRHIIFMWKQRYRYIFISTLAYLEYFKYLKLNIKISILNININIKYLNCLSMRDRYYDSFFFDKIL